MAGRKLSPSYEFRLIHKNGSIIWVDGYSSIIEYHGQPAAQVLLFDLTERKQAKEALRESESEMILADPTEINQILMNLCTNSVHALSEETCVLEVSLESISLDKDSASQYENLNTGNFVKLTVKNTGQGIDPEIIDRIFDPYFTTKDIGKGTGMGLGQKSWV